MIYIKSNLNCLPMAIKRQQEQDTPMNDALKIKVLKKNKYKLEWFYKNAIQTKLDNVLYKFIGYSKICKVFKVLMGEEDNITNLKLPEELTTNDILYFK